MRNQRKIADRWNQGGRLNRETAKGSSFRRGELGTPMNVRHGLRAIRLAALLLGRTPLGRRRFKAFGGFISMVRVVVIAMAGAENAGGCRDD